MLECHSLCNLIRSKRGVLRGSLGVDDLGGNIGTQLAHLQKFMGTR